MKDGSGSRSRRFNILFFSSSTFASVAFIFWAHARAWVRVRYLFAVYFQERWRPSAFAFASTVSLLESFLLPLFALQFISFLPRVRLDFSPFPPFPRPLTVFCLPLSLNSIYSMRSYFLPSVVYRGVCPKFYDFSGFALFFCLFVNLPPHAFPVGGRDIS